jgi:hypothetical protein
MNMEDWCENLISNVIWLVINIRKRVSFLKSKIIVECDREATSKPNWNPNPLQRVWNV